MLYLESEINIFTVYCLLLKHLKSSCTIGLFHMTLGDYDYGMLGTTPYPKMAKVVFVLFQERYHDYLY